MGKVVASELRSGYTAAERSYDRFSSSGDSVGDCLRRQIHGHMEKQVRSYNEAETLGYIIQVIKSGKKTGVKR